MNNIPIWNWPAICLDALVLICATILTIVFKDGDWMWLILLTMLTGHPILRKELDD